MALSSGKPVIFYCEKLPRSQLFRDVHPLTKLIDFKTGVANGAMIAEKVEEVVKLLRHIFENTMSYELVRDLDDQAGVMKAGFRLKDRVTGSTVRIQTADTFLSTSFWNYLHNHVKGR